MADADRGSEGRSDPPNGYLPLFISARSATDVGAYPPFVTDHHLIGHFSPWLSTRQHKRLKSNNAGAISDNSNNSDDAIQELDVVGNISEEETEEEIPGGGKPSPARTRSVSYKTKCCLFF